MKEKKHTNSFHLRIYDAELLKSMEELLQTKRYDSMNELLNCALGYGLEKIYLEFGKRKLFTKPRLIPEIPETKKIDRVEHQLKRLQTLSEDIFILMHSVEGLTASIFNVQRANVKGEALNEELLDSGYLAALPDAYREIKDNLVERFNRKLAKEQKE